MHANCTYLVPTVGIPSAIAGAAPEAICKPAREAPATFVAHFGTARMFHAVATDAQAISISTTNFMVMIYVRVYVEVSER
jgi:hypothetical protein